MASIDLKDASVSYFIRKRVEKSDGDLGRGSVGANIVRSGAHLEIQALRNINIHIGEGERVGLIGVNGSGKSTLLQLCAGALSVQKGSIKIDGKVSPQFSLGSGVRRSLSGRRNAELKCLYMGTPQRSIPDRVEEIKQLSGLGGFFELPVSSYSAGMRSRLVMSMLRLVRAEILVMDEWIGAADATVNQTVGRLQRELIGNAAILVIASHSRQVLTDWTTRLIWLDRGDIRMDGPLDEVHDAYQAWMKDR